MTTPSITEIDNKVRENNIKQLEALANENYEKMQSLPLMSIDRHYYESCYFHYKRQADDLRQGVS